MRRLPTLAIVLVLTALAGCTYPARDFVEAVDTAWQAIGPEYVQYLQADPNLSAEAKITRARTAQLLTLAIEEAKKTP
jgi:hypothetical protein